MVVMSGFNPYYTSDGSVGLYNEDVDDIYHSAQGALTEAYEKFIYPSNILDLALKDSAKILDICFGIGYNTKSFLNSVLKIKKFDKKFLKNISVYKYGIDTIYTNNKLHSVFKFFPEKIKYCTEKVYTHNIFNKIYIKAIDIDKNLALLSPFIKTGKKNFDNKDFPFYKKISKYLAKTTTPKQKINNLINYLLFYKIYSNNKEHLNNNKLISILDNKEYELYFDKKIIRLFKVLLKEVSINPNKHTINPFLHNIYYKYVSKGYKNDLEHYNLQDIEFDLKISDARSELLKDKNMYDLIFLDAFSPNKCPCLWTYDFFKELYNHLDDDGMILTYTTSAAVRSAMLESGFYIGNSYNKRHKQNCGTIAVKNQKLIKHPLSEFDLGLLKTKAGIFYRDKDLTAQNEAIITQRNLEVNTSNKMSSSRYINNKKNH